MSTPDPQPGGRERSQGEPAEVALEAWWERHAHGLPSPESAFLDGFDAGADDGFTRSRAAQDQVRGAAEDLITALRDRAAAAEQRVRELERAAQAVVDRYRMRSWPSPSLSELIVSLGHVLRGEEPPAPRENDDAP